MSDVRSPPGRLASIWLLARLRMRRRVNMLFASFGKFGSRAKTVRAGTGGKKKTRWILMSFITATFLLTAINVSYNLVRHLHIAIDAPQAQVDTGATKSQAGRTVRSAPTGPFSAPLARGLALELALVLAATLCASLGTRELAQTDWDLEWLVTLPMRTEAILWGRIVERTATEPYGVFALWPLCGVIAWQCGYRWAAVLIGAFACLALTFLVALGRTVVDTGLRLALSPARMRNVQAAISLAGAVLFLVALAPAMQGTGAELLAGIARDAPQWVMWTPPGLVLQMLDARGFGPTLQYAALLSLEIAVVLVAGMRLLRYQLRNGVVNQGGRESGRKAVYVDARPAAGGGLLDRFPVKRRELILLARDRNFLMQTMVLPLLPIAVFGFLNTRGEDLAAVFNSAPAAAAVAFGTAAYVLQFSALQALNSESNALWLLYSFPRSIDSVLKEKARLWSFLALIYPISILLVAASFSQDAYLPLLGYGLLALLGVPAYAAIGTALSVFANDPLATETRRLRPVYVYLYLALSSIYIYALAAVRWWQILEFLVLATLLGMALWQKARDELPYLLDPTASPPPRVSASDGLIAAMLFFVLQVLIASVLQVTETAEGGPMILYAFAGAGAITYVLMRFTYWRARTTLVPTILGAGVVRAVREGFLGGVLAACVGVGYVMTVPGDFLSDVPSHHVDIGLWLLPLAVIAAPVFEEFIFRGLIFGGLRRSLGVAPAVLASAAVFAVVHPPAAIAPVFILGACAALVYERSKMLLAPMITHAVYNAVIVTYHLLAPN